MWMWLIQVTCVVREHDLNFKCVCAQVHTTNVSEEGGIVSKT